MDGYAIRTLTRGEVDIAVDWASAEGWNPGPGDAECFHAADAGGFLAGFLGEKPVATISVVRYGASFGFLGFYIVKPEWRGRGYGLRLWNAGMARLEGRVVGLDGVVSQQDNYRKSGFVPAYRNVRYQGNGGAFSGMGAGMGAATPDPDIVPLLSLPFGDVRAYDAPFFPGDRSAFLERWIWQAGSVALGILRKGKLAGYGVARPCRTGYKIGPLFAESPHLAECLFTALKTSLPEGAPVFLDVPETNPEAVKLARRHGMTVVFETARMYKGTMPDLPLQRLFGVTSFELG